MDIAAEEEALIRRKQLVCVLLKQAKPKAWAKPEPKQIKAKPSLSQA